MSAVLAHPRLEPVEHDSAEHHPRRDDRRDEVRIRVAVEGQRNQGEEEAQEQEVLLRRPPHGERPPGRHQQSQHEQGPDERVLHDAGEQVAPLGEETCLAQRGVGHAAGGRRRILRPSCESPAVQPEQRHRDEHETSAEPAPAPPADFPAFEAGQDGENDRRGRNEEDRLQADQQRDREARAGQEQPGHVARSAPTAANTGTAERRTNRSGRTGSWLREPRRSRT